MRECANCDRIIIPNLQWRAAPSEQRKVWTHTGRARHQARGLCTICYLRAKRTGTLADWPRLTVKWTDAAEEWDFLADPTRTNAENVRNLAPRLGMTEGALEHMLVQLAIRSPFDCQGRRKGAA